MWYCSGNLSDQLMASLTVAIWCSGALNLQGVEGSFRGPNWTAICTMWGFSGTFTACTDVQSGCRSPEKPGTMLIKRLLALEGDWVTVPGRMEVEKIPKVQA